MLLRDNRSVMQRRWHGQKGGGDLLAWFGPLIFTICEIWGVILREDVFSWGCKTGKKWVQNACEANLTVKTQCFCGSVRDGELCQIDSHRAWMDGWIFCVCNMFAFPLLLLTGDRGGSDDYYCIPGSLLAQRFGTSPPQDFPPLYFAAPTWECAYPGYTYQQDQHTIPGKTSRKEVQVLSMDVGSIVKWEVSYYSWVFV